MSAAVTRDAVPGARLRDRVIVVTGGANGLGRAYVEHLTAAGARTVIADVDAGVGEVAASIERERCLGLRVDVTDGRQVDALVEAVLARWGRIDALVNNAGGSLYPSAPFETVPRAQWDHVVAVNLTSQFLCAAAVVPTMREAGYGKIVNVCSTTLERGTPEGMVPYIAAKGGVVGLTRALSHELGRFHICVNAISPGFVRVDTPKAVHTPAAAAALADAIVAEQSIHRPQTPGDLCGAVEFFCSADSDFVTGQVLSVDGGWTHR